MIECSVAHKLAEVYKYKTVLGRNISLNFFFLRRVTEEAIWDTLEASTNNLPFIEWDNETKNISLISNIILRSIYLRSLLRMWRFNICLFFGGHIIVWFLAQGIFWSISHGVRSDWTVHASFFFWAFFPRLFGTPMPLSRSYGIAEFVILQNPQMCSSPPCLLNNFH